MRETGSLSAKRAFIDYPKEGAVLFFLACMRSVQRDDYLTDLGLCAHIIMRCRVFLQPGEDMIDLWLEELRCQAIKNKSLCSLDCSPIRRNP